MDIAELFRIFIRRWWLIALPPLLAAIIAAPQFISGLNGASGGFTAQLRYSAAQKLSLPERDGDYTDIWQASEYTVDALTDWVRSASFRAEIAAQFADEDASLAGLGIAADNARALGLIYFSHSDGDALQDIVDSAQIVLATRSQHYFPQFGGESALVTILEDATVAAAPTPLSTRLAPLMQLGIALLLGLALACIAEYIDPKIYHQDDLRRMGVSLLGSIPAD